MAKSEQSLPKRSNPQENVPTLDLIEAKLYLEEIQDGSQADIKNALVKAEKLLRGETDSDSIQAARSEIEDLIAAPLISVTMLEKAGSLLSSVIDARLAAFDEPEAKNA